MLEKDRHEVQRRRIERIADELIPGCTVEFDPNEPASLLRFRIDAPVVGTILGISGHNFASEVADWSDEKLSAYIQAIAPSSV